MRLMLAITNRCNKTCAHCSFSSSPGDRDELTLQQMRDYIDEAAAMSGKEYDGWGSTGPLDIRFTGGEPFLRYGDLIAMVRYARSRGAMAVGCTTNGYWAVSPAEARNKLDELVGAGLTNIRLSCDQFHDSFEQPETVRNAFRAAVDINLPIGLKVVVYRGSIRAADVLRKLEDFTPGTIFHVEELPLLPIGRAGEFSPGTFLKTPGLPAQPCRMLGSFTVGADSHAYPCCSPGWPQLLHLGNAGKERLSVILNKAFRSSLFQAIRRKGPIFLVPYLERAGIKFPPGSFVNICDLCHKVLRAAGSNDKAGACLEQVFADWEDEKKRIRSALETAQALFGITL